MKIFNTFSRKEEEFIPIEKGKVGMYVCGVTVYGPLHMGHARTYVAYDLIRNYFTHFKNMDALFVQNITDVGHIVGDVDEGEDKIQRKARLEQKHPMEIVDMYIKEMWEGLDILKCDRPNIAPRATGHIVEIIDTIMGLIKRRHAYEVDGDIYFDVSSFKDYGKLSGIDGERLMKGVRIEANPKKRNPADFALWKKSDKSHIMQWTSPWGKGYPGWHIECSVMSTKYLGTTFDIHGGARELSFPHHENEIAQSEALTNKKMVNYWVHTGLLSIGGQKMAKSTGNFITVKDAIEKYSPEVLRFFILANQYSSPIDLKDETIDSARASLGRINNFLFQLRHNPKQEYNPDLRERLNKLEHGFMDAMDNDFNTPIALAEIFGFINYANEVVHEGEYNHKNADEIENYFRKLDKVFKSFSFEEGNHGEIDRTVVESLIAERTKAKKKKDWATADTLREKLKGMGVELFDKKDGATDYKITKSS